MHHQHFLMHLFLITFAEYAQKQEKGRFSCHNCRLSYYLNSDVTKGDIY